MRRRTKAPRLRPHEVSVPDQVWMNRGITEGAKHLWCCLLILRKEYDVLTFLQVRLVSGISHNSLIKYISELETHGWLRIQRLGLRRFSFELIKPKGRAILLPSDLILAKTLKTPAIWVWGVIRRHRKGFDYRSIARLTGYCRNSLAKYLSQLQESGWLVGSTGRLTRFKSFSLTATNPAAERRQRAAQLVQRRISMAAQQPGHSAGQRLMAEVVELLVTPGTIMVENGGINLLENPETGGRLQYDLYLPEYRLALEFHGPQHAAPTEHFPCVESFEAQERRDRLKQELSRLAGISLAVLWAEQLTIPNLHGLLKAAGVQLRESLNEVWHIYEILSHALGAYRARAAA